MPTIDELVVKIGLDIKDLQKGQKEVEDALKKSKESAVKHGTAIEGAIGKASDSIETLAGKALAVFAIFAGARSIEQFTAKITSMDAAVGRLSASMGRSPDEVSAIGKAVERMGGSADTAMSGLRGLSDAFEDLRTKGSTAIMEPLARLQALSGKSIEFGKDVHRNLLSIADALKAEAAKDPALAHNLGRQILGSDDLVNLAIQGRAAVLAAEAKSRQLGVVTPQDAQAGQNLITTFRELSELAENVGRKILTAAEPALTAAMKAVEAWSVKNREWIQTGIVDAIRALIDWLQKIDWAAVGKQVSDFGSAFMTAAGAVDSLAKAFAPGGALSAGIVAFGALALAQVSGPLATLARTMAALGLINPATLVGTGIVIGGLADAEMAKRTAKAMGDPDAKFDPETGFVNDLDFGYGGKGDPKAKGGGAWDWIKSKLGFGDKKDDRVADDISATAEGVKALVKQGEKAQGGGDVAVAGTFGKPSDTGVGGRGAPSLRFGRGSDGQYRRGGHGGGGRNYADSPDGSGHGEVVKGDMGERALKAMDYLVEKKGYTPEGAAIAVGNAMQESGVAANGRPGDHGISHSMFQWNRERWAAYQRFSAERHKDTGDFYNALDFFDEERKHRSGLEAQWHAQRDLRNAGRLGHLFEGYGDNSEGTRVQNARNVLDAYRRRHAAQGAGTPAPSAAAQSDADKFKARQRALMGGKTSLLDGLYRKAPAHVAGIAAGAQMAAHAAQAGAVYHNDNSSEAHIGTINVHTAATDAQGIATDIGPALRRGQRAAAANYGLA